jgi:hypothetical protein
MSANSNKQLLDRAQGAVRAATKRRQDAEAALRKASREYVPGKFGLLNTQFKAAKEREVQAVSALQVLKKKLGLK